MTVDARSGYDRRQRLEPWAGPERRFGERRALVGVPSQPAGGYLSTRLVAALADPWFRLLTVVFVLAQALDLGTTYAALASGRFAEGNPLFGNVVGAHQGLTVMTKLVVAVGVVVVSAAEITSVGRRRLAVGAVAAVSLLGPGLNLLRVAGLI